MVANPLMEGLSETRQPPAFTLVIFGATGDLTARKLVPALYGLFRENPLPREFAAKSRVMQHHGRESSGEGGRFH